MTTVAPGGRLRSAHHRVTAALTDVVADALAMLDGAAIADPESEQAAEPLPSDEQEFAAPPRDRP
jgi:hypothetical protein